MDRPIAETESRPSLDRRSSDQFPKVVWMTRQIALDIDDRDSYVDLSIQELAVLAVFLAILVASCSGLYSHETYVVNKEMSSLFVDTSFFASKDDGDYDLDDVVSIKYNDIITMEHFWKYFYDVLYKKLYDTSIGSEGNGDEILHENKFLFRPRVRQVRVEEGHCEIRNPFKGLFTECYVPYEIKYEDKASFGPGTGTQWTYSDMSTTHGVFYKGEIAYYGPGGYYFDFPIGKSDAKALIEDLEYNTWLNRGTRAVFVDFVIYNCNINVICAVKLVFEFPASGGIMPSSSFRTVKLSVVTNYTLLGMIVVIGFIIYYTMEETFELYYFRLNYFKVFWNVVDFGIVVLGWCIVVIVSVIAYKEPMSSLKDDRTSVKYYEGLIDRHEMLVWLMGYTFFLASVKFVKYTDLNRPLTVIYLSVARCFKIVTGYLLIMAVVVSSIAVLGYCAFGAQVKEFSTVNESVLSAIRILMRDFDFRLLEHTDQTFITFFFVLFTCVVIFVLLTMLVAVSFHAYFDVNVEESLSERKLYVCDKVSAFVVNALKWIGFKKWAARHQNNKLKMNDVDRHIDYQEVYKLLKRCRFTNSEVENILERYGVGPKTAVHEDDARQMFRDVLQKDVKSSEGNATQDPSSDVEWLIKRVDLLENSIDAAHEKCDVVIARLNEIRVQLPTNYAEDRTRDTGGYDG